MLTGHLLLRGQASSCWAAAWTWLGLSLWCGGRPLGGTTARPGPRLRVGALICMISLPKLGNRHSQVSLLVVLGPARSFAYSRSPL